MKKKLIGLFTSVALMGSGVALANDDWKKQEPQQQTQGQGQGTGGTGAAGAEQPGSRQQGEPYGGSGQMGMGQRQMGTQQLTGRVVKSGKEKIFVEHMGAIVPLTINRETQFAGQDLKRAQDIKEGDQIRASFEIQETENVVKRLQKADAGMGGSGPGGLMEPDPSINQPPGTLPPADPGIGGGGDLDVNEAPGADTGEVLDPDVGADDY